MSTERGRTGTDSPHVLELRGIVKHFGGVKAVNDVSLSITRGSLHCLIGPNGAGKSTLFKIIMGVHKPSAGTVLLNGRDITRKKPWDRVKAGLSIKEQIPGVFDGLTVYDNMRIANRGHGAHTHINDLLEFVGISHLVDATVANLSHGQQQWLEIAMALAGDPEVLLLDEPAAGMGPEETEFTASLVRKVNAGGTTVVFIDHDMEFVRRTAESVTVLHLGRVFADGTIEEIESNHEVVDIYLGKA